MSRQFYPPVLTIWRKVLEKENFQFKNFWLPLKLVALLLKTLIKSLQPMINIFLLLASLDTGD